MIPDLTALATVQWLERSDVPEYSRVFQGASACVPGAGRVVARVIENSHETAEVVF